MSTKGGTILRAVSATISRHVNGQLKRHIVVRELSAKWERGRNVDAIGWDQFFAEAQPRTSSFSQKTLHSYATNLRKWLVFAGLLEEEGKYLSRPIDIGKQAGHFVAIGRKPSSFLGTTSPQSLLRLLVKLTTTNGYLTRAELIAQGLRNATLDASSLDLITVSRDGKIAIKHQAASEEELIQYLKNTILEQECIRIIAKAYEENIEDMAEIGQRIKAHLGAAWKPTSTRRYSNGLKRYFQWARIGH